MLHMGGVTPKDQFTTEKTSRCHLHGENVYNYATINQRLQFQSQ